MKKINCLLLLLSSALASHAQSVIIKGKVKCENPSPNSTKGAENVIVVPAFEPSRATATASQPAGYFECNTGLPLDRLQDKLVTVYLVSRCTQCKEQSKRVFISEDQDRQNRNDGKQYVTVKDWMMNADCKKAEMPALATDSLLNIITKQPGQDLDKASAATALTGTPALLNLLTSIATVAAAGFPSGDFTAKTLAPGKIRYGQFLMASPLYESGNTGFNLTPVRDMSEAMFWNPSAMAFSRKPNNISLLTNFKNNLKLGGYFPVTKQISIGAGFIYTAQDQFRQVGYVDVNDNPRNPSIDSVAMNLKEFAGFVVAAYRLNNKFSLGLTVKSGWQQFNNPDKINISNDGKQTTFTDVQINKQYFDFDISATYRISTAFQAGINFMNLAGNSLYGDAFVKGQANIPMQKQRSVGVGLSYKWQRLNVGADAIFNEDGLYDATVGANYVPFNNAVIAAGMSFRQLSYSISFRIKYFRIAWIDDNNWMVNEKKTGKINLLNGRIYGGFIFDLK